MHSYIQILTTPTADTSGTTILLHFDSKRYLIGNLGEGTQRATIQRGTKLTKLTNIFLTGKTEWENTGGLIGMILTLADATASSVAEAKLRLNEIAEKKRRRADNGETQAQNRLDSYNTNKDTGGGEEDVEKPTLTIHGGRNLTHTLATARRFVFRQGMPINVEEIEEEGASMKKDPTWTDENIRVWAMSISPSSTEDPEPLQRQRSARKRSYDEFEDHGNASGLHSDPNNESPAEQRDRAQQIRKAIVSEMFDSAWRLDSLNECPLAQVRLPAALFIRNPETKKIETYTGPLPGGEEPLPDITVLIRKPWPGALIETLPPTESSQEAVSYIIRNYPQRGRFLPNKATELNVKKGSNWSQLAAGQTVLSEDGKTVMPDMVLEPGKEGGGVAIVDLPTADYLDNLVTRPEWRAPEVMTGVEAIIWILGPGVGQDERLLGFVKEFSHLKHLVSSVDACPNYLAFDSAASSAIRLNQVDPVRFPIPVHDNVTLPQPRQRSERSGDCLKSLIQTQPFLQAQRGQMVQLEPTVEIKDRFIASSLNTALVLQETPKDVLQLGQEARKELIREETQRNLEEWQADIPSKDAEIITLGTGSALPSKYRNVSSTLLRVPGYGSYLLDCGENTLGQLRRIFPPDELAEVLRDLKLIWISHLHADHHLGTVSVVKAWYEEVHGGKPAEPSCTLTQQLLNPAKVLRDEQRLFIASDKAMNNWLKEYASVEDYGFDRLVPLSVASFRQSTTGPVKTRNVTNLTWDGRPMGFNTFDSALNKALTTATGLADLQAVDVNHCHGAKAVTLTFPNGFKFSYSGDCRPSLPFAEIGKGSTVLLHEATFEDELQGDALAKKHSTTSEALGVGVAMGARRVLLTHFSQRYQKIPNLEGMGGLEVGLEDDDNDNDEEGTDADVAMVDVPSAAPVDKQATATSTSTATADVKVKVKTRTPIPDMKVGVAFDYMRVKVGEIAHLEKFRPALLRLLEQPEAEEKVGKGVENGGVENGGVEGGKGKGKGGKKAGKKGR
ncbi:MAG: hypothetical protein M1830_000320 [Pleopsidium flavum]|nr:MAG: hypothetical protein M1830_000320 [Pleopsidium flavum]